MNNVHHELKDIMDKVEDYYGIKIGTEVGYFPENNTTYEYDIKDDEKLKRKMRVQCEKFIDSLSDKQRKKLKIFMAWMNHCQRFHWDEDSYGIFKKI